MDKMDFLFKNTLALLMGCFVVTACGGKSFFSESEDQIQAEEATEAAEDAQANEEGDSDISIEPISPLEALEQLGPGPAVSLLINEASDDYEADINQDFVLSYVSKEVENCELSFEGAALGSQEASQTLKAEKQGTFSLTCYDSGGEAHSDARKLSFKAITQSVTGSETITSAPTDVIFAVDTSGSMSEEMAKLQQTLPVFIEQMSLEFPGDAFQMFMLSADELELGDLGAANPRYHHIASEVDSNNALEVVLNFGQQHACPPDQTAGCLREASNKELVIISDDDSDLSVTEFKAMIRGAVELEVDDKAKGKDKDKDDDDLEVMSELWMEKTHVNGFVGLDLNSNTPDCDIASIGQTYIDLAADSATKGLVQHLCEENYAQLLANLKDSIVTKHVQAEFELDYCADSNHPISIKIDGGDELASEQYTLEDKVLKLVDGIGAEQLLEIVYTPTICEPEAEPEAEESEEEKDAEDADADAAAE